MPITVEKEIAVESYLLEYQGKCPEYDFGEVTEKTVSS